MKTGCSAKKLAATPNTPNRQLTEWQEKITHAIINDLILKSTE